MNRCVRLIAILAIAGCSQPSEPPLGPSLERSSDSRSEATASAAVMYWNQAATDVVGAMNLPIPLPPMPESRIYAMTAGAVHDALNAIVPRYRQYAYQDRAPRQVNAAAAVAGAVEAILRPVVVAAAADPVFPNPNPGQVLDQAWHSFLATIPDGPEKAAGLALGNAAAAAMLARRANDGSGGAGLAPYSGTGVPGAYRPTPPFGFDPDYLTGLADAQTWGSVRPFAIPSGAAFRSGPPYGTEDPSVAVRRLRYAADFNEVKALGGATSHRTQEQTDIALFWMENSPRGWNRVAQILGARRRLDGWQLGRLFALLHFAEADAYITSLESKYHYKFWRPITAIRFADQDNNPRTAADPAWDVLTSTFGVPTPPVPEFPSAHATAGGAAAAILEATFGRVEFSMSSTTLPGAVRTFRSIGAAARENAESRVFIGYHFRHATEVGLDQGRRIGQFVVRNGLPRN